MPISLHSHSGQFCKHATDSLESVVQTAIDLGFISYGLSEHMPRNRMVDLYPEERDLKPSDLEDQFNKFILEASRLKQLHSSTITLLIGIETELIDTSVTFDLLDQTLARHQDSLDYLVGSVHHVNQIPIDFDLQMFEKAVLSFESPLHHQDPLLQSSNQNSLEPIYQLCAAYFDSQHELINKYQPEVIGHFDLCLLFHPNLDLQSEPLVWNKIQRNVRLSISYGALFEVNSAAIRKGWSTPYPSPPILKLIISLGGRLTLSDDSHGSNRVGLNYDKIFEYLKCNHVQSLWHLAPIQDNEVFRPRNKVSAVKIPHNWWDHPFWTKISPTTATTTQCQTTSNEIHNLPPSTTCPSPIQLASLKFSDPGLQASSGNIVHNHQDERLKWKNFPIEKFTNQTWFIISSSLLFWKNKKNATITYSSLNNQPINVLDDLVEYHSSLADEPSSRRKQLEGVDRPIQGDNQKSKNEPFDDQILEWRWQGKGLLRLLKSDWQLLGYHFSSSTPSTTNNNQLDSPDWVIAFFDKTPFYPAGINICSKSPSALSDQLKLQLIQALQQHPSKVVSNSADLMFNIPHDESID